MKLNGKTVLLTGGAAGIGRATLEMLLQEGCIVSVWDRDIRPLDSSGLFTQYPNKLYAYNCDISDTSMMQKTLTLTLNDLGYIDILINNAGILVPGTLLEQSLDDINRTIEVNLSSLIRLTRLVLPAMWERNSGHIVNVSSAAAFLGVPGIAVYGASKWAVWGFTESLRHEALNAGKNGLRFSSIHPNFVAKGLFEGSKLKGLGGIFFPQVKNHQVIARAIVIAALKKGRYSPKRPRSVRASILLRGLLPDPIFQHAIRFFGVSRSMESWTGPKNR